MESLLSFMRMHRVALAGYAVVVSAMVAGVWSLVVALVNALASARAARLDFKRKYLLEHLTPLFTYLLQRDQNVRVLLSVSAKSVSQSGFKPQARSAAESFDVAVGRYYSLIEFSKTAESAFDLLMSADAECQGRILVLLESGFDAELVKELRVELSTFNAQAVLLRKAMEDLIFSV